MSWLRELIFNNNITGVNENVVNNTSVMLDVFVWLIPIFGLLYVIKNILEWKSNKDYNKKLLLNLKNLKILKDCGWEKKN